MERNTLLDAVLVVKHLLKWKNTRMNEILNLSLKRTVFYSDCTIGELYSNGQFECFTLEDVPRTEKVYGQTAIPVGEYRITVDYSNRFKRHLPLLHNVPQFEGVRIHPGNTAKDTEGCILVGRKVNGHSIEESRLAFNSLFPKIEAASQCSITIS
jgi:hypothetical protein